MIISDTLTYMKLKSQKEKRDTAEERFEEIVGENFPKLVIDTKPQIQEAQRTPSKINAQRNDIQAYHFQITECHKLRKKIPREGRGKKHLTYRG